MPIRNAHLVSRLAKPNPPEPAADPFFADQVPVNDETRPSAEEVERVRRALEHHNATKNRSQR